MEKNNKSLVKGLLARQKSRMVELMYVNSFQTSSTSQDKTHI